MEKINGIESLLKTAKGIVKQHEKIEKDTGYKFNIFTVTKIEHLEVNTHSAMIAELLNPNGSHGQGNIFLIKFIDCIKNYLKASRITPSTINYNHVKVLKEKSFNKRKDRIDIYLELNDFILLIENKINAPDGEKQLKRYYDIGVNSKKKFCLLYLTKYGNDASKNSHCGIQYERISYREEIVEWLECCIKEVALVPIVREAILQYLNLVKKITGISMTNELKENMVKLLLDGNNLQYAQVIANSINNAKGKQLFNFFEKTNDAILENDSKYIVINSAKLSEIYDENKCIEWFRGRKKVQGIGFFIDISIKNILLHVEVATNALHYGFVKVQIDGNGKYTILDEKINCPEEFEKRNWNRIKWYSTIYELNIRSNIDILNAEKEFIDHILENIEKIKNITS